MNFDPRKIHPQSLLKTSMLRNVRTQDPNLPFLECYGAVDVIGDEFHITHTVKGKVFSHRVVLEGDSLEERLKHEIKKILSHHNHKMIATSFTERQLLKKIAPRLWLEEDIVSFYIDDPQHKGTTTVEERLKMVISNFNLQHIANIRMKKYNEVVVTDLVSLEDYKKLSLQNDFTILMKAAQQCKGKRITYINATPQGGGVAAMRHALMRLFKLLDVDAHWHILEPNDNVFNITKRKFHNVLHAVSDDRTVLTEEDKRLYNAWIKKNFQILRNAFNKSDAVVIDDPQPSGLIPYIRKNNPKAKIIYRSHIQIMSDLTSIKGSPQYRTWRFLWEHIKHADIFVSHPVPSFIPKEVPKEKIVFMPATTDHLDGLNKPLTEEQMSHYIALFNKFLKEEKQSPIDPQRPYIIQIARFDPSKGIPDVLEAYRKLTEMLQKKGVQSPQLVITGNGSIDDPDRILILNKTLNIINTPLYAHLKEDIKVAALPHIDQLLNTLLRKSKIALQLSTKEGFETKVTEALMKGKPVIAYKTGGIPLQIKDNVNGFLVKPGNTHLVAQRLYELLTDEKLYKKMNQAAESGYDKSLLTIPNAIRWLQLIQRLF